MELSSNPYQNAKNKKRLIIQNLKLYNQITQIQEHLNNIQEPNMLANDTKTENVQARPIIQQIVVQEKLIRKLKAQIQLYKLQRAKDNVEYIVHQEDDLKLAKKLQLQLMDQKQILLNKKIDKNASLQKDVPYQNYQKKFLVDLTELIHHNRQQGSKITQIQREIRKYHMMKKAKDMPVEKPPSPQMLDVILLQISQKVELRNNLQKRWIPHFAELDEQYAVMLHQLAQKKQQLSELQRQQKSWQIRLAPMRDVQKIINDKSRMEKVKTNPKLTQKIIDFIQHEEDRKKKKVNEQVLKYQFLSKKKQEEPKEEVKKTAPPPLPGVKKKEERIYQTTHNDKNITKKIDKNFVKKNKLDQNTNTDISVPSRQQSANKLSRKDSVGVSFQNKPQEERAQRLWQNSNLPEPPSPTDNRSPTKNSEGGLIRLKEIAVETSARLWKGEQMSGEVE